MNERLINKSIVILAAIHNPTVVSENFFERIGYIQDASEIENDNIIITPAFSSIVFKNKVVITLEPEKLEIRSEEQGDIENLAKLYCNNLKFIRCRGVGLNYNLELTEFNTPNYFKNIQTINYKESFVRAIEYRFPFKERNNCNVRIVNTNEEKAFVNFNFNYVFADTMLGELGLDFINEKEANIVWAKEFIAEIK